MMFRKIQQVKIYMHKKYIFFLLLLCIIENYLMNLFNFKSTRKIIKYGYLFIAPPELDVNKTKVRL